MSRPPRAQFPWMPPEGQVECINVPAETALTSAYEARFDFAKVRTLVLIDWSDVQDNGDATHWMRWERWR